ncbi:MAG: hypothetical protein ACTSYC_10700 [Promethearchaeota archaeon]
MVASRKTNVYAVITTNITDMIKLNLIIKILRKKLKKIPHPKEIKSISVVIKVSRTSVL